MKGFARTASPSGSQSAAIFESGNPATKLERRQLGQTAEPPDERPTTIASLRRTIVCFAVRLPPLPAFVETRGRYYGCDCRLACWGPRARAEAGECTVDMQPSPQGFGEGLGRAGLGLRKAGTASIRCSGICCEGAANCVWTTRWRASGRPVLPRGAGSPRKQQRVCIFSAQTRAYSLASSCRFALSECPRCAHASCSSGVMVVGVSSASTELHRIVSSNPGAEKMKVRAIGSPDESLF